MPRFSANLLVFYIADDLKGDLIICFNVLKLLCKGHVKTSMLHGTNTVASLNYHNWYKIINEQHIFH